MTDVHLPTGCQVSSGGGGGYASNTRPQLFSFLPKVFWTVIKEKVKSGKSVSGSKHQFIVVPLDEAASQSQQTSIGRREKSIYAEMVVPLHRLAVQV